LKPDTTYHALIIGAGAAGYFAAIRLAELRPDWKIALVEKTSKTLQKVKISGGGRCNVTHACFDPDLLLENYPRGADFLRHSLQKFGPVQTIAWFEKRGVKLKTEADGRMFPSTDQSETIVNCLHGELLKRKIQLMMQTDIEEIKKLDQGFRLKTKSGSLDTKCLLVATGGHPKTSGYLWLAQLGMAVVEPVPSLFTFNLPGHAIVVLQGISVPNAEISVSGFARKTIGPLLVTHWGLSGPAILKMSAWAARYLADKNYQFQFHVKWLPHMNESRLLEALKAMMEKHPRQWVHSRPLFDLPARLWKYFCSEAGIGEQQRWAETGKKHMHKLVEILTGQQFLANGKTTFKEEFVTAGGIDLSEVRPETMESKLLDGLYFAGEVLDIDGVTGGFNFQAAWATGYAAAEGMAKVDSTAI